MIARNLEVKNSRRNNLAIPCSGSEGKTGYYRLEYPRNYGEGITGDYLVNVKFRNDDGTVSQHSGIGAII